MARQFTLWLSLVLVGVVPISAVAAEIPSHCETSGGYCACIGYSQTHADVWRHREFGKVTGWPHSSIPTGSDVRIEMTLGQDQFENGFDNAIDTWYNGSFTALFPFDYVSGEIIDVPNYLVTPFWFGWQERVAIATQDDPNHPKLDLTGATIVVDTDPIDGDIGTITFAYVLFPYNPKWRDDQGVLQDAWFGYGCGQTSSCNQVHTYVYDYLYIAMHEYGHVLGLTHHSTFANDGVMDPMTPHNAMRRPLDCEFKFAHHVYDDWHPDAFVEHFAATPESGLVALRWRTTYEVESQTFLIEHSNARAGPFALVDTIPANNAQDYNISTNYATNGWYRLREVETDGDTLVHAQDSVFTAIAPGGDGFGESGVDSINGMLLEAFPTPQPGILVQNAEWICITPQAFVAAAQPLANFWTSQGHAAAVVSLETIGGVGAIKTYIAGLAGGTLRYVLLGGDANDDVSRRWEIVRGSSLIICPCRGCADSSSDGCAVDRHTGRSLLLPAGCCGREDRTTLGDRCVRDDSVRIKPVPWSGNSQSRSNYGSAEHSGLRSSAERCSRTGYLPRRECDSSTPNFLGPDQRQLSMNAEPRTALCPLMLVCLLLSHCAGPVGAQPNATFSAYQALAPGDLATLKVKLTYGGPQFSPASSVILGQNPASIALTAFDSYYTPGFSHRNDAAVDPRAASMTNVDLQALIDSVATLPAVTDTIPDHQSIVSFTLLATVDGSSRAFESLVNQANARLLIERIRGALNQNARANEVVREFACELNLLLAPAMLEKTSQVTVTFSGLKLDRKTGEYVGKVRVTNDENPARVTPIVLLLPIPASSVEVVNASGRTCRINPSAVPYIVLPVAGSLPRNASVEFNVRYLNPDRERIVFPARLFAGPGEP